MGILDDLAMGFGFKEKDRDYYDRTEQTMRRTQGDARADQYNKYLGRTESGFESSSRYAAAPNYGTAIGPSVADFRQVPNTGRRREPIRRLRHASARTTSPDLRPSATETSAARSPAHCRTC